MDVLDRADKVDAVVDYHAESRAGDHVLDVAARSEPDGMLQVELTVSGRGGEVVGEGALRLPPEVLPPAERVLAQVLRGLAQLHWLPDVMPRPTDEAAPDPAQRAASLVGGRGGPAAGGLGGRRAGGPDRGRPRPQHQCDPVPAAQARAHRPRPPRVAGAAGRGPVAP